ncbi:MAG: asparagine synthase (glutamine-hydrolyzing) [Nitrospirae bacterium]|nr:asparagine synthase (glutamine-hydrolyzing) [Nitrospirota bacterium]
MCGICGIVSNSIDVQVLKMVRELKHRGPDNQNIVNLGNVWFGHTRLKIIDLSDNANQPMFNESGDICIVYNGEFYNFMDYRNELIEKGHTFKSNTDTEVILHLFEEDGIECIKKIRGMFAFAIWNKKKEELFLVRDRVGIKPLYYYYDGKLFIFASELKAILKHPNVSKEIDFDALSVYFSLGYIPQSMSIFKKIKKLLPGHYLQFKNNNISIERYWSLPNINQKILLKDENDLVDQLYVMINEAVKLRLISDVPLGIFLSGGIDSSIVATLAAKNSNAPIKTFSIGFEDTKYNELPYARMVAKHIGSDHHEFIVRINETEVIGKLAYYYDEPFADSSAIPTYYVSKMAREHVTVAFSGDGGDELFGGYNWYEWMLSHQKLKMVPSTLKKAIAGVAAIPKKSYKGKHFLTSLKYDEFETFRERTGIFSPSEIKKLLNCELDVTLDFYEDYFKTSGETLLERLTRTDFAFYLPDDILVKVDRASMAVALEARVPILDHKVCEFAFSLCDSLKINGKTKKYLLKKLARKILPDDFPIERKQGFSIPLSEWMKGSLGDLLINALRSFKNKSFLNEVYVEKLLQDHKLGKSNNASKLWSVLMFSLWFNNYY